MGRRTAGGPHMIPTASSDRYHGRAGPISWEVVAMTTSKDRAVVRAIVEDRMDQLAVAPIVGTDSGSEIEVSQLWRQIGADLHEVAARVAGGEVDAFGMRDLVD